MSGDLLMVQHNLQAMNANRQLGLVTGRRAKSAEKLSSGYRINRAADDAAGLAISEKMRRQIRGLQQGTKNVQDGISLLQIADGALAEVTDMLQRMNELAVKAANGTLEATDRDYIQSEISQIKDEIDRVGESTTFNERQILGDINPNSTKVTKLTDLVRSSAAESGSLTEAYLKDGRYYPAATLDFSGIDASNLSVLNGRGFSFTCAQSCSEVFQFTFDTTTSASRIEGSTTYHRGTHNYVIGLQGCQSGNDIIDRIFDFAYNTPLQSIPAGVTSTPTSIPVSHANTIDKTGDAQLVVWGKVNGNGYATAEGAKNHRFSAGYGEIDVSSFTGAVVESDDRNLWIQAGADADDGMYITVNRINGDTIGVRGVNVRTQLGARSAISAVKNALRTVSTERASLGAQQNRLEHTYNNNQNKVENTMNVESLIRDTDMSEEMVRYSNENVLQQVGQSLLAQANQSKQGILSLLS